MQTEAPPLQSAERVSLLEQKLGGGIITQDEYETLRGKDAMGHSRNGSVENFGMDYSRQSSVDRPVNTATAVPDNAVVPMVSIFQVLGINLTGASDPEIEHANKKQEERHELATRLANIAEGLVGKGAKPPALQSAERANLLKQKLTNGVITQEEYTALLGKDACAIEFESPS